MFPWRRGGSRLLQEATRGQNIKIITFWITVKKSSPVPIVPEPFSCWSNLGRLGEVGKGGVTVCQPVLYSFKCAHPVVFRKCGAVLGVTIPLAPGLEEDWHSAIILSPDGVHNSIGLGNDVVVHLTEIAVILHMC